MLGGQLACPVSSARLGMSALQPRIRGIYFSYSMSYSSSFNRDPQRCTRCPGEVRLSKGWGVGSNLCWQNQSIPLPRAGLPMAHPPHNLSTLCSAFSPPFPATPPAFLGWPYLPAQVWKSVHCLCAVLPTPIISNTLLCVFATLLVQHKRCAGPKIL